MSDRWEEKLERRAERFERQAEKLRQKADRRADRQARKEERGMGHRRYFSHEGKTTLYRSRNGMICGICKGIADYYSFDVFWTRVLFVIAAVCTQVVPALVLYVIAAVVMKPEPVLPLETEEDEEFYHSYTGSRTMALNRLKRTYDNMDRRIQRIESAVTARDFDWDERLNR